MKFDEIDRILREDDTIQPSSDFAAHTMRAVRHEAENLGAIRFPWMRVVPGIVVCVLAVVAGLIVGVPPVDLKAFDELVGKAVQSVPMEALAATLIPLAASWALVRVSLRFAGYER